jgi:hypothetical protein
MNLLAWIGSICFATCAIPQIIFAIKNRTAAGLSWGLLILWSGGEICYVIFTSYNHMWPLLLNYGFNSISLTVLWVIKIREGKKPNEKSK